MAACCFRQKILWKWYILYQTVKVSFGRLTADHAAFPAENAVFTAHIYAQITFRHIQMEDIRMIYLIRHGQTEKNKANVLQGRSDFPLNEAGEQQAQEAASLLAAGGIHFDRVYTSPLIRAVQTAEIIAPDSPRSVEERLIEMDYGPYEGMDLTHPLPEVMTFFRDFVHNPAPEGMEPLSEVTARLGEFLEEIREEAASSDLLLSTHAIAMKGALEYTTPDSQGSWWSRYIGNCAVYCIAVDTEGGFLVPRPWPGQNG